MGVNSAVRQREDIRKEEKLTSKIGNSDKMASNFSLKHS